VPVLALYTTHFADLRVIQGYSYSRCLYLTSNYKELRSHLNSRHQIKSSDKQGDSLVSLYCFPIALQTFRSHSRNIAYFITSQNVRPDTGTAQLEGSHDADAKHALNDYQTFYKQLINRSEENRKDLGSKELSGFLLNSH
jgi:hypothetical protein